MCQEHFVRIVDNLVISIAPLATAMTQNVWAMDLGIPFILNGPVSHFSNFLQKNHVNGSCEFGYRYPDEINSTKIIGERQFKKAVDLFISATLELTGKIDYKQVYLNITNIEVQLDQNKVVRTCPAALGAGFAAGTTDGPGAFGFQQGDTEVSHLPFFSLFPSFSFR